MLIRPLHTDSELQQCVELQHETWGADFDDFVPPSILKVAQKIGGVAAGAFDERGEMLGFVFGMAGVKQGRIIHWSDMLAVRAASRDSGVGRRLKEFQRQAARASGAVTMYWTYDPLVARNAHLNFNRLGVTVDEYIEDMYGASESELHRGLGTDRFVVAWPLDREPKVPGPLSAAERRAPVLDVETLHERRPPSLRIEIPHDIMSVRNASPAKAAAWRQRTRRDFQWSLANGYTVKGFFTDPAGEHAYYVLTQAKKP
jgi:predicted GNAT superfamily acetyltransferase